jgi:hypothetical protein
MKLQVLSAALLFSLSQFSFAAPPKPANCPSISALKAVGVSVLVQEKEGWVGFMPSDNFATKEKWSFMMGAFKAKNKEEAKNKMINAISSFSLEKGPFPFSFGGKDGWVCAYKDKSGHIAQTMTPPMDVLDTQLLHNI